MKAANRPEPDPEARRIGDNVRRARRARGLSLEVVAGLAGRSGAWLSMIERGLRPLERRSDIAALATALNISPTDLVMVDVPYGIGGEPDGVQELRDLFFHTAIDDPPDVAARPVCKLAEIADDLIAALYRAADPRNEVKALPPVLAELHVQAASGDEANRQQALRLIVVLSNRARAALKNLGLVDLAWIAADRARDAAAVLGDPIYQGVAWFGRAHTWPSYGQAGPLDRSAAAAERLRPHLGQEILGHQVYGMLQLSAALAAQVAGSDDIAQEHLLEAKQTADRVGERPNPYCFGPANVAVWQMMIDVEAGRPSQALRIGPTVDPRPLNPERRAAVENYSARAYAMLGRGHEAEIVQHLHRAEHLAPHHTHHNPLVRELVVDMLDHAHRTTVGRELRGLAHRMKIAS